MRLSRHARNRLRWVARRHPHVTSASVLEALFTADELGYDERGNKRLRAQLEEVTLTLVIDAEEAIVITLWVE